MNPETFRTKVRAYLRSVDVAQATLARELGLHPGALSHKLNGKGRFKLSQPEVKKIIKFLAQSDAISTWREAVELLEAMGLKATSFGVEEWQTAPLSRLEVENEVTAAKGEQTVGKAGAIVGTGQPSFHDNGSSATAIATQQPPTLTIPDEADNPPRHNLPAQPTPLIGREGETAQARSVLRRADVRMLSLVGTGGIGKTRLALQIASDLLPDFRDGAWLVSLTVVRDPALLANAIATALGVKETPGGTPLQSLADTLKNHLRDRQILLLLDNFEQIRAAAPLLGELLETAPKLKLLVTSRIVLRLYGEHKFEVPPLSLPNIKTGTNRSDLPSLDILSRSDAIALFVQRARAVKPDFVLNSANAAPIVEICTRLDGLPLAIELAAAWLRMLTPEELLARLLNQHTQVTRIKLLTGGATNLPTHKQTLHNTMEWSYQLLETEAERRLFRQLGIFVGGGTWEAIQAICFEADSEDKTDPAEDVAIEWLNILAALLDKSIVRRLEQINPADNKVETRFVMLETIREYALAKLADGQEIGLLRQRHAEYYVQFTELAYPKLLGAEQPQWLNRLNYDYANVRSIYDWTLVSPIENNWATQAALRLGNNLVQFWAMYGYFSEGFHWMNKAIARVAANPDLLTNPVLVGLLARLLPKAGSLLIQLNQFDQALPLMEQSVVLARNLGDKKILAFSLSAAGELLAMMNQTTKAVALLEESLQLLEEVAEPTYEMIVLNGLGVAAEVQGDYKKAVHYFERGVKLTKKLNMTFATQVSLFNLGQASLLDKQYDKAHSTFRECITSCVASGNRSEIFLSLYGLAGLASVQGQNYQNLLRTARLIGAAETFGKTFSLLVNEADRALLEPLLNAAQSQLDPAIWQQAWNEGRALNSDQTIAFALG